MINFKSKVNVEINHSSVLPEGFEYESRRSKADINYDLDIQYTDWGIRGILYLMMDQEIEIEIEVLSVDPNVEDSEAITVKLKLENNEALNPKNIGSGMISTDSLEVTINSLKKDANGNWTGVASGQLSFSESSSDN